MILNKKACLGSEMWQGSKRCGVKGNCLTGSQTTWLNRCITAKIIRMCYIVHNTMLYSY